MASLFSDRERTHTCGALRKTDIGTKVLLKGWVQKRRDHGGVIFIDLRDRYGLTQIVFRPEEAATAHQKAQDIRSEYVIAIQGEVLARPAGMVNPKLPTGEIEVSAMEVEILSEAKAPPFPLDEETETSETVRLTYRYMDLRRPELQNNLFRRHKIISSMRQYLDEKQFVDIETPFLTRSTPEGARDYLVPSRVHPGKFFALPQSPQLFKQILMISGFDRYYQIVRCFRDEDLRADRQPEFTQLDLELTFATPFLVQRLIEEMFKEIFEKVMGETLDTPFPHLTYDHAMERYGSDKPDLRWPIEMRNLSPLFTNTGFKVFQDVLKSGGQIRGFRLPGGNQLSRSQIDQLTEKVQAFGAKGLIWIRETKEKRTSSVDKFLNPQELETVAKGLELQDGDLALLIGDKTAVGIAALNSLRLHTVEKLNIAPSKKFAFLWVDNFPLFEFDEEEKRYAAKHHPFTSPHLEDVETLKAGKNLEKVRAQAYDLVLNGFEIGGGSIRIHSPDLQQLMFERIGLSREEAKGKFGFFLEALQYGTPPHGGIALGVDRIAMLLSGTDAIRDVIAFPKTQSAIDLMAEAPNEVDAKQLKELHIQFLKTNR